MTTLRRLAGEKLVELNQAFVTKPDYAYQRMTTAEWRTVLLAERDSIIIDGLVRRLVATHLGAGVVEVRVAPVIKLREEP